MNKLHPGARWQFRLGSYSRFGGILIILVYFIFIRLLNTRLFFGESRSLAWVFVYIIAYLLFVIIIGEIYARMSYNRFLFEVNNQGVKIEQGIVWKKYTSIPYERIQNVDIKRGIIARALDFSTLDIETAGQSGFVHYYGRRNRKYKSEGHLPAVDIQGAEKIREHIMKRIKHSNIEGEGL